MAHFAVQKNDVYAGPVGAQGGVEKVKVGIGLGTSPDVHFVVGVLFPGLSVAENILRQVFLVFQTFVMIAGKTEKIHFGMGFGNFEKILFSAFRGRLSSKISPAIRIAETPFSPP